MKRKARSSKRAYKLAAELHARRGKRVAEADIAAVALEAGVDREHVRRALARIRANESRAEARAAASSRTDGARGWVGGIGAIASVVFGAAAVATLKDGWQLLSASAYVGAVLVLAMGIGMLVIAANVAYQAAASMRESLRRRR